MFSEREGAISRATTRLSAAQQRYALVRAHDVGNETCIETFCAFCLLFVSLFELDLVLAAKTKSYNNVPGNNVDYYILPLH